VDLEENDLYIKEGRVHHGRKSLDKKKKGGKREWKNIAYTSGVSTGPTRSKVGREGTLLKGAVERKE